jgi:methyl-accepting chemotaxis protein
MEMEGWHGSCNGLDIMNKFTRRFENSAKLVSIAVLALIAFSVYGWYCFNTVDKVKIGGPHYRSIALGNELVADVLPPGEFLVETYLTAFEMMDAEDRELGELIVKFLKLKLVFLERNAYWNAVLADDSLKQALMGKATLSGNGMIETMENAFIPALQAKDLPRARELLRETMRRQFREHKEGVDAVVRIAAVRNLENEKIVADMVGERTLGLVIMGLSMVMLLAVACIWLVYQCEAELKSRLFGMLTGAVPLSRDLREKMMWN